MIRSALHDRRFWFLAAALSVLLLALLLPRVAMTRPSYDALAVVDITDSMNTRDMPVGSTQGSRLEAAKSALRAMLAEMPCQSRLGLGIFSERRIFILFEPIEVCGNFASIDRSISELDWRMAWQGDSYIAHGVYDAIANAALLHADLLFFTDGHEAPPLPYTGEPPFDGKPGAVGGLIVGVGGHTLSPIPKFDDEGHEIGFYQEGDVLQESRFGSPPPGSEKRPGYNPRNNPFGTMPHGNEHLSSVKEDHLRTIARDTGLTYAYLGAPGRLLGKFEAAAHPHEVSVDVDIRPYPASLAFVLLLIVYGVLPFADRWQPMLARARRRFLPSFNSTQKEAHA